MTVWLRSALFLLWFGVITTILSLIFLPVLVLPRRATVWLARLWSRATFWGLKIFAGIDFEIRGRAPKGPVLVAAKHMSMWDTMALYLVLDQPAIVLKRGASFRLRLATRFPSTSGTAKHLEIGAGGHKRYGENCP